MALPTVTLGELSDATVDPTTNAAAKRVQEGILNDFMDLQYGKETPYTTGKEVLPQGTTEDDLKKAINDDTTEKKFKEIFTVILETYKSGDLTPRTPYGGTWDPKFKPVLVLVTPNK